MDASDEVSTNTPISYSDVPEEKNIFDTRFTGCGKTTLALQYIAEVVSKDRPVIVLMLSYERLEDNYYPQIKTAFPDRTLVFRGKTQKGLCKNSKKYQEIYKNKQIPKNECDNCSDFKTCAYQNQLNILAKFKQSKKGFCVLTTEKNLNNKSISDVLNNLNPVLIIDDISLSSVVMPELEIERYDLKSLVDHLHEQDSEAQHLFNLSLLLYKFTEESKSEIKTYIIDNEAQLIRELIQFQTDSEGKGRLPSHKSLPFLSSLIYKVKTSDYLHFYQGKKLLKIVADETSKFNSRKVIYLNATPSLKDHYCIDRLGTYEPLTAKVKDTKRYAVFQVIDSATIKRFVRDSEKMRGEIEELITAIKPSLEFTKQQLLIFGDDEVLEEWKKHDVFSGLKFAEEKYFGSGTRGTNNYKDYPISFILGTPYYPPEYFLHPAFESKWKTEAEIEKERKKNPNGFISYVGRDISDIEAKINLLQMIGRNLRDSTDNPDSVKVVVVYTSIDIAKECKEQNGGLVIPTKIRGEMSIIRGKTKAKTPYFDRYKKICRMALKPKILKFIETHIDNKFNTNGNTPIPLDQLATALQKQITIYGSVEGIKKLITTIYDTEKRDEISDGKSIPTLFITKKKPV